MTETDALNPDMTLQRVAPLRGEELAALVEAGMPAEPNLRMEVTLVPPRPADPFLRIGLRIGERKWFVVRDLPAFLRAWRSRTPLSFQSRFEYDPSWMRFSEEDRQVLALLDRMAAVWDLDGRVPSQRDSRLLKLPDAFARDLLSLMQDRPFRIMREEGIP